MNRGSKAIVAAGLAAFAVFAPVTGGVSTASADSWRNHHGYTYARYYHYYRHYGYGWHRHYYRHYAYRHYYYGPGPIFGGLGLLAGAAAALTVGPYPYYYGGPYYGYWW
jgi:hypothetical protein